MKKYWPLALIVLLGALLRSYQLSGISLWHDEAFSALMIRYPWGEMISRLGLDVHPPMYYIVLRLWHYLFGDTLWSLRGMSAFFGTGAIIMGYFLALEIFRSKRAAVWAALLLALSPFQLQYVTEARMYTMGAFFALAAAYLLVRALQGQLESRSAEQPGASRKYLFYYAGFALSAAVCDLTHYYLLFTTAGLGFYGLIYHLRHYGLHLKKYGALAASYAAIALLFLPWLKTFLFQYRQVQAGYWIEKMNIWSIPSTLWDMLLGFARDINNSGTQKALVLATIFSVFFLIQFLRRTKSFEKWLVLVSVLAPFAGSLLFLLLARMKGSDSSVYLVRYFLFASAFYSIALAGFLAEIGARRIGASLLAIYCAVNLLAISRYWKDLNVAARPGMGAAAQFLGANVEPSHHVFVGTSYEFFNYSYYAKTYYPLAGSVRPLLYTGGRGDVSQISHVEGVALLSNEDLLPDFGAAVHSGEIVWLIWTEAFGSHKPETPGNWVRIDERGYQDIRPYAGTVIYVTEYRVN